jgi:hypothetical protein
MTAPNQQCPTSCKTHIDVLRLFLEYFEFEDDINCTGLLGLRRLLSNSSKCYDTSCSHSLTRPETFYWALNIFQEQISGRNPSMGHGIALMMLSAVNADDVELVERLIVLAGDINSKDIIKWFSPGHFQALQMGTYGLRKTTRALVASGLNLHVVADDDFDGIRDEICLNESPTSLMMRHSQSFFSLRNLLRELNIDIQKFVEDELEQGPLRKGGWTPERLLELFELDFQPFNPPAIQCHGGWQRARENSWLTTLERLKLRPDGFRNSREILRSRDEDIFNNRDIGETTCAFCQDLALKSPQDDVEDNSPFLISL